jgi:hypothetical protein
VSKVLSAFWSIPPEELQRALDTKQEGLDEDEAQKRLRQYGANLLEARKKSFPLLLLLSSSRAQ